jgi:hypothetical protein
VCVPILRVHRDSSGVITHVGGSTQDGVPWGLTVAEAVALQESSLFSFFVEAPPGQIVSVLVKTSPAGKKYLTTSPDGVAANNLDSLPNMPNPLEGVQPPFPLNIPGPITTHLMSVTSIGYSGNHTLTSLTTSPLTPTGTATKFTRPASFWSQTPRWFYLKAIVPFPADIMVFENAFSLERVPSDSPGRRHDLETARKGWWSFDFVLTRPDGSFDPTKPSRLTEITVIIRPGSSAWSKKNIFLSLSAFSINPNCYIHPPPLPGEAPWGTSRHGSGVAFQIQEPAAPPLPPPEPTATMPSVVGQRLNKALITLSELHLNQVFVIAPVAMSSDLNVDSQSPAAGTTLKRTAPIVLKASLAVAQTGVQKIVVFNQSNRAKPLDLWLFDYGTGAWDKKNTVAYQAQSEVVLADGHTYQLAAVDPTLLNCHTGRPDQVSCVYSAPQRSFVGDENGLVVPWQVT